jgi:hypothetical protein
MLASSAALLAAVLLAQVTATPDTLAPPLGAVPDGDSLVPSLPGAPAAPSPPGAGPGPLTLPTLPPGGVRAELWRGARVGMTPTQVAALNPGVRPAAPLLVTRPPVPNAVVGAAAVMAVSDQVFGYPALATYYFSPVTGLVEVVVSVRDLRLRHTLDNVGIARDIRAGLQGYYGQPKVCLDTAKRGLVRLDCRWTSRSVQVGLSYVDYGGLSPNLDVAVRATPPKIREQGAVFGRHGAT